MRRRRRDFRVSTKPSTNTVIAWMGAETRSWWKGETSRGRSRCGDISHRSLAIATFPSLSQQLLYTHAINGSTINQDVIDEPEPEGHTPATRSELPHGIAMQILQDDNVSVYGWLQRG